MAKFHGIIGFAETVQTAPGIYKEQFTEHTYFGDILELSSRWSTTSDSTNDDLTFNGQISIVADPFARQKFHSIKYVEVEGIRWKVTSVKPGYPRLILTIGGVFNG